MSSYHGWTHARKEDGGTDPIPFPPAGERPWIVLENLGQTLASGSFKHSLFTDAYWDPTLVTGDPLAAGADDNPYFSLAVATEDTTDYYELTTKVEGWYTAEFVHLWSNLTALTNPVAFAAEQITFNTVGIPFFHDRHIGAAAVWLDDNDGGELAGHAYIHAYRTVWLPASKAWPAFVRQSTGDNRDVSGHLKVWYESGDFGGGGDNAGWSFSTV